MNIKAGSMMVVRACCTCSGWEKGHVPSVSTLSFTFFPCPLLFLFCTSTSVSLFSLSLGDDTKWHTMVVSLNKNLKTK